HRPELTAERFLADPFSSEPGARMDKTGDLGRWLADGNIEFLGRNDFQVKIRGFRIELGEIEARLTQHPAVREAVVVAREDSPGDKRLVAYYVRREGNGQGGSSEDAVDAEELRSHLLVHLPEYMVPAAYVRMEALPLTPNGKLDQKALPAPDMHRSDRGYVAPRTVVEKCLARIWAEVLKRDRVGIYDNFFALGGDSIHTISAVSKAKDQGLVFSIEYIFKYPTIAGLINALSHESPGGLFPTQQESISLITESDQSLLPQDIEDAYNLSCLQLGMVFHSQDSPDCGMYHDVFSYHLRVANWSVEKFQIVLDALVNKHAILRTSFDLHR